MTATTAPLPPVGVHAATARIIDLPSTVIFYWLYVVAYAWALMLTPIIALGTGAWKHATVSDSLGTAVLLLFGGAIAVWCVHMARAPRGPLVIDPVAGYVEFPVMDASGNVARRATLKAAIPAHRGRMYFPDILSVERCMRRGSYSATPYLRLRDVYGALTIDVAEPTLSEIETLLARAGFPQS